MAVSEWERRELCPDGGCTGVIGPEGTCKTCGRAAPNWGDERKRGMVASGADGDADGDADADADEHDESGEIDPIVPRAKAEIGEWRERQLCSDGACIGVIDANGKCKTCGKPADSSAEDDEDDEDAAYDGEDAEYDDDDEAGEEDGDDDEADDELAAAADELAGVASRDEVETANEIATGASDADDDDRQNCPDGACIGLIGRDGKCKVCGTSAP